ncbi:MAG: glycerol dehydrogenase [Pseudomonadota bacterium]
MRIFAATSRYMQGPGLLDQIGLHTRELGRCAALVIDEPVHALLGERLRSSCERAGLALHLLSFPGEVTLAAIDALQRAARDCGADVVIGVGGGKALDAAKAVARALGARMVSVPTVASNDGPASASVAVYDEQHRMSEVLQLKRNPDLVLVDSAVIAAAPLRYFLAGIGDAISKKFEAEACLRAGALTLFGAPASHTGLMAADACYRLIRSHAQAAVAAVKNGVVTDDVESVIEATVLLSTISFENGGLSVAHAIARGLPCLERAAGTLHGAHVAYGLLVQLTMELRPAGEMAELIAFYRELGLPCSLADLLGGAPSAAEIDSLADNSMLSPSAARFTPAVSAAWLRQTIGALELRQA